MANIILSMVSVLTVIYIVPIIVYGIFSRLVGAKIPQGVSPLRFLLGVLVAKTGTAIAFVLLFYCAANFWCGHWMLYAFIWWLMFLINEVGQTVGPNYSWKEALAGIVSESIYFPVAAYLLHGLLKI